MDQTQFPKTTSNLSKGDYALIRRSDGRYVPLVFLAHVPRKRVVFYGALIEMVLDTPHIESDGEPIRLGELALIDVAAFEAAQAPLVGSLLARLDQADLTKQLHRQTQNARVWGRLTPIKYANQFCT